ncbi:unnamed protein product [Pieris macdunnoughi]|uniref:DDE Tnp4 domain-containing protein n=1 Tax=Pieris macdunnoughi TaxID=345717 RepID=A0A821WP13_9NEOP|nr:unnamed protein product [Pieris macdunnoughi]
MDRRSRDPRSKKSRVVENAFGVLNSVCRVLHKPILLEPEKATKVMLVTVYLYNYLRSNPNLRSSVSFYTIQGNGEIVPGSWRSEQAPTSLLPIDAIPRRASQNAKDIRSHLARHFITNGAIV